MAWMVVAGCWRGASVALGEVSSLAAVGGPLAGGCRVCGRLLSCKQMYGPGWSLGMAPWATASEGL